MRRRTVAAGVGLALSLSVTGCEKAPVAPAPEQPLPTLAESNVSQKVVSAAAASVAIRGGDMQGSGEVITVNGRKMVLTAGHVGRLAADKQCGNTEVDAITAGEPKKLPVRSVAGVYEGTAITARDAALLGVSGDALAGVAAAPVASKTPAVGEHVFIVSWQPEGVGSLMGSQRNPVYGPLTRPAIIGATYEGNINEHVGVFTPNGTSYDAESGEKNASDTTFKSEGSGSAVVNDQGEVIAEVAKSSTNNLAAQPELQTELDTLLGKRLAAPDGVALGHVVSSAIVTDVQTRQLVPASDCPLP